MATSSKRDVLIIYTGGTIGSLPKDPTNPLSPLVPKSLDQVLAPVPTYDSGENKIAIEGKWIRVGLHPWEKPLDSSNVGPKDWVEMVQVIKKNEELFDGIVILHGTDTLAYTASALAFMLDNLTIPVIITGSQRPIGQTRSDAQQNLVTAVEIAAAKAFGRPIVPEVCVFFRDHLYRGCRTTKMDASGYAGFASPNCPSLGTAGDDIQLDEPVIRKPRLPQALSVFTNLETQIASMDIFPGMSAQLLENMLMSEGLRGIVLKTFGTGNAPDHPDFLAAIKKAVDANRLIVDVTQCKAGEVRLGLYDVSTGLLSRGVISGMDMTPEAALAKMAVVLGTESDPAVAADAMQINLRGEQRQSIFNLHFPAGAASDDTPAVLKPTRPMHLGQAKYKPEFLDKAFVRILDMTPPDGYRGNIELKVYIDLPSANESTPEEGNRYFLGRWRSPRGWKGESISAVLQITDQVREFVDNSHVNSITIVSTGSPFGWARVNIACFANC